MRKKEKISAYIFLLIFISLSLFPIFWMLDSSFKSPREIVAMPPIWFPVPTLENYIKIFKARPFAHYTVNSLIVALSVSALCIALGTPAAYGFSRFKFWGSNSLFGLIIATRLVPPVSFIVPFTIIFTTLKMMDTLPALIIAYIFFNLPFVTWILVGFFGAIPRDLDDAARIDGCNHINTFWWVILPLARPGIIASAILAFLMSWNDFMFALVLTRVRSKTLPIGITDFFADHFIDWSQLAAATMYTTVPAIIFVLLFQKHLIKGMLAGAVKG